MKYTVRVLACALAALMLFATSTVPAGAHVADAALVPALTDVVNGNPIVVENRRVGSAGWRIPWAGKVVATDRNMAIKGYASAISINQGESLRVRVHAASAGAATYHVYRLGWYQGLGGRYVTSGNFTAPTQPKCTTTMPEGLISCPWSNTLAIPTSTDWTSGVYVVILTKGSYQSYVPFVVRNDSRKGAIVHMQATFTWQAYNMFPNDGATGKSLYGYNSFGAITSNGTTGAVKVSFDRPYWDSGAGNVMVDDAPLVRYQESRGFDVTYLTDLDLHQNPGLALGQEGLVSVGHDEYWTGEMFTAAEAARDDGVDVALFGANNVYWQVRLEPSTSGQANRVVVCYRDATLDPNKDSTRTVRFRELPRPEQPLIGQMWPTFDGTGMVKDDAPWVVRNAAHWLYRGSGLADGSTIPYLVGVETDRRHTEFPAPTLMQGTTEAVLAQSPYVTRYDGSGLQESTLYTASSGATVFSAGTLRYTRALMGEGAYAQQTVRSMTTNLLNRFSGAAIDAPVTRVAGTTRYETAVGLSQKFFPKPAVPVVFVATGTSYPDALAASAATGGQGPVLLVGQNELPTIVADELGRLAPARVVIAGGSGAVSSAVAEAVSAAAGVTAERMGGVDRYATAAEVSKRTFAPGVPVAYVATGLDFPDALAAGAAGAQYGGPVLLTGGTSLSAAAKTELTRLAPRRIVLVGGTGVVSDSVKTALTSITSQVVRLGGVDRYETAMLVARDTYGAKRVSTVAVATGMDFPDALAAGPAVASTGGTLLLAGSTLTPALAEEAVRTDPAQVVVAGGSGAVSEAVLEGLRGLYTRPTLAPAPAPTRVPMAAAPADDPAVPNGENLLRRTAVGTDTVPWSSTEPALPWLTLPTAGWQYDPAKP